jgi:hypothetical protein
VTLREALIRSGALHPGPGFYLPAALDLNGASTTPTLRLTPEERATFEAGARARRRTDGTGPAPTAGALLDWLGRRR